MKPTHPIHPGRPVLKLSVITGLAVLLVLAVAAVRGDVIAAGEALQLTRFSSLAPGTLPNNGQWRHQTLNKITPNQASIQRNTPDRNYLVVRSEKSGSAWIHAVPESLQSASRLEWQWFIRGAPGRSALREKSADDFPARVYIIFDYPLAKVPFGQRLAIRLARAIYGDVPAASLCYVWLPGATDGELADSPYTSRVKMLVANTETEGSGWQRQRRDIEADFQRAFGKEHGPGVPPIKAIVVSADTDQTGGLVDAAFSDILLGK